jgi:hypothetical protein
LSENGAPKAEGAFTQARDIAFVFAILLYFAAFDYRWELFQSFGVDVGLFEVPTFSMIVYALPVLESTPGIMALVVLVVAAVAAFVVLRDFAMPVSRPIATACAFIATLVALQVAAHVLASFNHDEIRAGSARNVAFTLRDPDKMKLAEAIEAARLQCIQHTNEPGVYRNCYLYLLADSKDSVYVLWQKPGTNTLARVIELRKDELASLSISVTH